MSDDELDRRMAELASAEDADDEARRRAILRGKLFSQAAPARMGRFALHERLGAGAMGTVYRAHDDVLDRPVAIKVLRGGRDDHASQRLLREARGLARLTHPNVVTVYEVGDVDGQPYVAMEYVQGRNLADWQEGRARAECVRAYLDAARGLAAVHGAGLVHRDFKPANVLVGDDGRVRVADFGLVRTQGAATAPTGGAAPTADAELTATGALLGTPAYMAPEQLLGGVADRRSDQFAFCVALYEAVSGRRPFEGRSSAELLAAMRRGPASTSHLPGPLGRALSRGLAVSPEERWPGMEALAEALSPARRRGRWAVAALAAAGVAALALAGVRETAPPPAPVPAADDDAMSQVNARLSTDPTAAALLLRELDPQTPEWESAARRALTSAVSRHTIRPAKAVHWLRPHPAGGVVATMADGGLLHLDAAGERPAPRWWAWVGTRLAGDAAVRSALARVDEDLALSSLLVQTEDGLLRGLTADELVEVAPDGAVRRAPRPVGGPATLTPDGAALVTFPETGPAQRVPLGQAASRSELARDVRVHAVGDHVMAFGQADGALVVWKGGQRTDLEGLGETAGTLAVSPGDRWLAATASGRGRAWRLGEGHGALDLPGGLSARPPVFVTEDKVLLFDFSRGATLFDLRTRRSTAVQGHAREVLLAASDGVGLATYGRYRALKLWELGGVHGRLLGRHDGRIWSGALDPDGGRLATAGHDGVVRVFTLAGEAAPRELTGHTARKIYHVAFSSDGRLLASGSADGTARIWPLDEAGAEPQVLPGHAGWAYALAFSPDGTRLATGDREGAVRIWEVGSDGEGRLLGVHPSPGESLRVHTLAFTADGRSVASSAQNGSVMIWPVDPGGGPPIALPRHGEDAALARMPSGRLLTLTDDGVAREWTPAGEPVAAYPHDSPATGWAVVEAPARLAMAYADGAVRVWEVGRTDAPIARLPRRTGVCERLAFDASGQRLATGDTEGRIAVYQLPDPTPRWRFEGHSDAIRFLAFRGDDVVSASADGSVRIWQAPSTPSGMQALLADRTDECLLADQRVEWLGEAQADADLAHEACQGRARR